MTTTTTTTRALPRYAVMNHDRFQGYVQGRTAALAMEAARKLFPNKRLTLEPIRTGRHALGVSVKTDLNSIFASKRAPYDTGDFEARRKAAIATYA